MRIYAAMRAIIGADQATVASECGLSVITLANAEKGRASDKTAAALMAFYARHGLSVASLPGCHLAIVWQGQGIGAGDCQAGQAMRAQVEAAKLEAAKENEGGTKSRVLPTKGDLP